MLGILGIFLGIACLIVGAFKRVQAMPLTILAAIVVALTNGVNLWQALGVTYVGGFASGVQSYLLIFAGTCLYSKFMQTSGCVVKIGYTILDLVGKKNVVTACSLVGALLCYGGVSGFVFSFLLVPIMFTLFQEADIPRHLCIGPIMFACGTFVCSSLPGSTQLHTVIPCEFLGIKLTDGAVIGIVMSILLAAMHLFYLNRQVRIAHEKGEHFDFPEGTKAEDYMVDKSKLPPVWRAFAPLLTLIAIAIIGTNFTTNATMLTVIAVFSGCAVCLVLNFDVLVKNDLKALIGNGLSDGVSSIVSLASILGMGAVIQATVSYQNIVNALLSLEMNPYIKAVVSTAVISGIVGSGSGGIRVTYNTLGDYFLSMNLNPVYLQKLTSAASVTIDTLPHAAGPFLHNKLIGLTQRETYRHTFRITVVHTSIACALLLAYIMIVG